MVILTDAEKEVIFKMAERLGCGTNGDAITIYISEQTNEAMAYRLPTRITNELDKQSTDDIDENNIQTLLDYIFDRALKFNI